MKKALAFLIFTAILLTACSSGKTTGTSVTDPFVGGTTGIAVTFEDDAPPAEVYDGGAFPFSAVVKLQNLGEWNVPKENMVVTLSGILASDFGTTEAQLRLHPEDNLDATRKDSEGAVVESAPVYVSFDDINYQGTLTGNTDFTLRANICYDYGTRAVSKICIRKNNIDPDAEGVCEVNEDKKIFSSGSPLSVTNFKETARAKDKVAFTFQVIRDGSGKIVQQGTECAEDRKYEDRVWVEVDTGIEGLDCLGLREGTSTTGYITLFGDSKPITCTQTVTTNSDYEKDVKITLTYGYEDSKEANLLVKHSLS